MTPAVNAGRRRGPSETERTVPQPAFRAAASAPFASVSAPRITLQIDALVLHGFPAAERVVIADAITRELTRLFTERELPAGLHESRSIERINGGTLHIARGARQPTTGALVARTVFQSLQR